MKLKQEKRYLRKQIADIEEVISVYQFAIDFDANLSVVELKCRQQAIDELTVNLNAFCYYLNFLSGVKE